MTTPLPIAGIDSDVAAAALHGSFCPKMCNFACPVTAATGRDDAMPWSLHRTVSDLVTGRTDATDPAVTTALEPCTGCLACQGACAFDQDVPAQVREARAAVVAAGHGPDAASAATQRAATGESPYGGPLATAPSTAHGSDVVAVVVSFGCRDDAASLDALGRLLTAAGVSHAFVAPDGCCGGALTDLGHRDEAGRRRDTLAAALAAAGGGSARVVATDPHCLPSLRTAVDGDVEVIDVVSALDQLVTDGRLRLAGNLGAVAFHDPCLLARDEGVLDPPRRLLVAAGGTVVEPEGHGAATVCSGAGLGLELLAPADADATATRRATQLTATDAVVVTACAGAQHRLTAAGARTRDLLVVLADHLDPETP